MSVPGLSVLVVDDVPLMRRVVVSLLKKLGVTRIHEADSGPAALERLRSDGADVVISDWNMPAMSGLELLQAMRGDAGLKDISFLLVSANEEESDRQDALRCGVTGYLKKPFNLESFAAELQKAGASRAK